MEYSDTKKHSNRGKLDKGRDQKNGTEPTRKPKKSSNLEKKK